MEIQVVGKDGKYKFSFHGELSKSVLKYLNTNEQFRKDVMKTVSGKEYVYFTPILEKGAGFKNGIFEVVILFGDKIIINT